MNRRHVAALAWAGGYLGGCAAAPSFTFVGAFFPAWMACALLGVLAGIAARLVFVATGLSEFLPFQFFLCMAIGVIAAALVWLIWVGG